MRFVPAGLRENVATGYIPELRNIMAKTILVVDDNLVVQTACKRKLEARGFKVEVAADGSDAVHSLRATRPDLLLVDLDLPEKDTFSPLRWDGFIVVEWMHRLHTDKRVPFVMLTSSRDPAHRMKALALGAAGFFHKSADFQEVIAAIEQALADAPGQPAPGT
jgi:DNA-binding response OmpR family regulator